MLEGLPPNNAAHKLTLVADEKRARAVADRKKTPGLNAATTNVVYDFFHGS